MVGAATAGGLSGGAVVVAGGLAREVPTEEDPTRERLPGALRAATVSERAGFWRHQRELRLERTVGSGQ